MHLINSTNEILYSVAPAWDFDVDGQPLELVKNMTRVMFEHRGVGLAAPQIGESKRVFIMGNEDLLIACVNPILLSGTGEVLEMEGCLSFPNLWLRVKRSENISVQYYDIEGKLISTDFTGLMSRVFQHEREHLDGICFTSKVSRLSLDLAKKRQLKSRK